MKKGDVIYYGHNHKSHSWSNGLYVITKIDHKEQVIEIRKLNDKGEIAKTSSITGINENPYIKPTKLKYTNGTTK
jgi:hypothetical protein